MVQVIFFVPLVQYPKSLLFWLSRTRIPLIISEEKSGCFILLGFACVGFQYTTFVDDDSVHRIYKILNRLG